LAQLQQKDGHDHHSTNCIKLKTVPLTNLKAHIFQKVYDFFVWKDFYGISYKKTMWYFIL